MIQDTLTTRKPVALSNWKMAMSIQESLAFVRELEALTGDLLESVEVIICPPFTALWAVAAALEGSQLQLGAQNVASTTDLSYTGQISAALLSDVGCRWVMLGHWEVRRYLGDDDPTVNHKMHLVLAAGLTPILLVGESRGENAPLEEALDSHLSRILAGCQAEHVARIIFVYEPEGAIGVQEPVTPAHIATGCRFIRDWLAQHWDGALAEKARIIYGGSVAPEHAAGLLASPHVDGLGASRRGRDPASFAEIVRQIAQTKAG